MQLLFFTHQILTVCSYNFFNRTLFLIYLPDDLEDGSCLELCYYLGKLQEEGHALHRSAATARRGEKDILIKVRGGQRPHAGRQKPCDNCNLYINLLLLSRSVFGVQPVMVCALFLARDAICVCMNFQLK